MAIQYKFDQSAILEQSPLWSQSIVWGIAGVTSFTVVWASIYKIDEAIPVTGKLEPKGAVTDIQVPVDGVVKTVHVKDGQFVKKGELLVSLDNTATRAEIESLEKNRRVLLQENEFYRLILQNQTSPKQLKLNIIQHKISPEIAALAEGRSAIIAENQLFKAQLQGDANGIDLDREQQLRLGSRQQETSSEIALTELEIGKSQRQLLQNQARLAQTQKALAISQKILRNLKALENQGAFPKMEVLQRQQEAYEKASQVDQLKEENRRLNLEMSQTREQLRYSIAKSKERLLAQIAANNKSLAVIDSNLTKNLLDNQKQLNEVNHELTQARATLSYKNIISPADGSVFDLKAKNPGSVVNSSEAILKIVPNENLIANIYITNKDIGFVRKNQQVDVRIDSFPFHEFGDIKGEIIEIGSDALPPDEIHPYWRFPAKVRLHRQSLPLGDRELPLHSGMSINANIKLRSRTIISIITDFLIERAEGLKYLR